MRASRGYFTQSFQHDAGMLSRVAKRLYWMGLYLERAEHTTRLLDVELQLWLDQSPEMGAGRWRFLLEALHAPVAEGPVDPTQLVNTLVFSRTNASSIVSCISTARENLRHVREHGDVGATEPTVPGTDGNKTGRGVDAEVARFFPGGAGGRAPVLRNHRRDDEP